MDYLLDKYVFNFLPLTFNEGTKQMITSKAVDVLRVADWACKAQDVRKLAENHPSLLVAEVVFFLLYILTFVHAFRHGRRYIYTWFGINFIGMTIECLRFFNSLWDVVWHAQGTLTFLGMRIPFFLCGVYQFIFYISYVFSKRLYLRWWAEAPAAGLITTILIFPINLFGTKHLWFQWHSDDIAVADRWLSVPWTSLLFTSCISCCFTLLLQLMRKYFVPLRYDWKLFVREFFCVCFASTLSVFFVTAMMDLLVHACRRIWKINMGVPTCAILGLFTLLFFSNDRHNNRREARSWGEIRYWFDELFCAISIHFLFFMILPFIIDPVDIVAEGLHQPIGLCNVTEICRTVFGAIVSRKKYFCPYRSENFNPFDFHCLPDRLPPHSEGVGFVEWYPICGKEYDNRWEYVLLIWSFSLLSIAVLYQIGIKSGKTPVDLVKLYEAYLRSKSRYGDLYGRVVKSCMEEQDPDDFSSNSSDHGGDDVGVVNATSNEVLSGRNVKAQPYFEKSGAEVDNQEYDHQLQRNEEHAEDTSESVAHDNIEESGGTRTTKVKTSSTFEYSESPRTLRARKRNL